MVWGEAGKFTELLENEIQVLRSCRNNNIVQLIDIKKTANNIYLVLEYCNEGDLLHYVKGRKKLPQEEAVEYFVQILHAFQTLVKNKIMHRDFKLANVLKHDGYIKVADFGFSKLLGTEDQMVETILGSPLNMAPEVLDHKKYNSKADIWSIGVAFYEMIFGKYSPPQTECPTRPATSSTSSRRSRRTPWCSLSECTLTLRTSSNAC